VTDASQGGRPLPPAPPLLSAPAHSPSLSAARQVLYNAQMIRTWSLLLRTAHRRGYVVAGRNEAGQLVESPHLLHPIEHKTAGLYMTPVATCDFASLYPSLYRAYNLCYTTLVHPGG